MGKPQIIPIEQIEQDFYNVLLRTYLHGQQVKAAIAEVCKYTKTTFYAYRNQHPDLYQQAQERALADATTMRQQLQTQLLQQRMAAELQVQLAIVGKAAAIAENLADAASSKQDAAAMAAAKQIHDWATGGMLVPMAPEQVAATEEQEHLPYDPNVGIEAGKLSLPPGTKGTFTFTTPDILDSVPDGTEEDE
jgi:hypothetical protein